MCLRWVNVNLNPHEDFIGLHVVAKICADTLGQCYDGPSNMSGAKSGVATQIKVEELRAIFSHCYGRSLQLAVVDIMKETKKLKVA